MKKTFFITAILVFISLGLIWWFNIVPTEQQDSLPFFGSSNNNADKTTFPPVEGSATTSGKPSFISLDQSVYERRKMNTTLVTGRTIQVSNIKSAETVDSNNRQIFYFSFNRNDPNRLYDLVYYDEYDAFDVVLLHHPLTKARSEAETELIDLLGIKPEELCDMRIYVRTQIEPYKGQELGISFCRGARRI